MDFFQYKNGALHAEGIAVSQLVERFGTPLYIYSRDVLAALYRRRDGVTMSELSRMLLVSNGNATTVVDRLESDGHVRRTPSETDRRTVFVALTPPGVTLFERLADEHEREISRLFGGLSEADLYRLTEILKRMGGAA
jgi:DNA-binding MarR family transcriptional regulator